MGILLILVLVGTVPGAALMCQAVYWLAVVLLSVFGTLLTDNLVDNFGVPLEVTASVFGVAPGGDLCGMVRERENALDPLDPHHATGSVLLARDPVHLRARHGSGRPAWAETLNLGYLLSALLFGGRDRLVAVAHLRFRLNAVLAFWMARLHSHAPPRCVTRGLFSPQPTENGGLELGTVVTSAIFLLGNPRHGHLSVDHEARCGPRW